MTKCTQKPTKTLKRKDVVIPFLYKNSLCYLIISYFSGEDVELFTFNTKKYVYNFYLIVFLRCSSVQLVGTRPEEDTLHNVPGRIIIVK